MAARRRGLRFPISPTRMAMSISLSGTHWARKNSSSGSLICEPILTTPATS